MCTRAHLWSRTHVVSSLAGIHQMHNRCECANVLESKEPYKRDDILQKRPVIYIRCITGRIIHHAHMSCFLMDHVWILTHKKRLPNNEIKNEILKTGLYPLHTYIWGGYD